MSNLVPAAAPSTPGEAPRLQRLRGSARVSWTRRGDATVLDDLYQAGALRLRMPKAHTPERPEAVLINTGGGLTGGDRVEVAADAGPGAHAVLTTQACEKIYRARDGEADVHGTLRLGEAAELTWLPQPAIVFDGAALRRSVHIEAAPSARVFALEATVLGRVAMGEELARCRVHERWRVRVGSRLVWASEQHIEDPCGAARLACNLGDARAAATFVYVGEDAPARLAHLRALLAETPAEAGASAMSHVLVALALLRDPAALVDCLGTVIAGFTGRAMPRVWTC